MSSEEDKIARSKRRHRTESVIAKQVKIAKQHGITMHDADVKQPHRLAKRHAMDCGNPGCHMCANPRQIFGEMTIQEKRFYQDPEMTRDIRSNGLMMVEE